MRIATAQYQSNMNQSLTLNQERLSKLTQQMASGKRIGVPSDDPVDSVRVSRLQREEAAIGQYRNNIASIKIRLSKNEGYLGSMVNDIAAGRDQLVWALDGSNTTADLQAMVSPLEALRDSLLFSANSVDQEGRYVFSGTNTATAPMAYDAAAPAGARYSYAGNVNEQRVVVGNGLTQVANDNVKGMEQLLNRLDATIAALGSASLNVNAPATRAVLEANLAGFDDALELVSSKIAVIGGKQNILDTLDANHGNVSLSNQMAITDIGQLDMGLAATELNGYSTALQATYKAYGRIGTLSLFSAL
ncbi:MULTISPECIES: flagellar hook-associated protein FlgL [unclassified Massilia]|uniref:flagellar hook-associated protein FlgL n=1 Tax=unclassified Massilia TaxID=2609279 RepID=UPI001781F4F0|nr:MULTISPECIES: flagellar hook-associated protein FlgL [unclassified Massilia]MBD8529005.1 flagellar hook-associated protein FlgL [Massilia sp. CFBP 13647]MBD8672399.1 flagellar hook-associated protein FlgL [Massilia sp. CFBP 13721]